MFKKYFEIKIDKPCTENWENMLPSDRGRFCNSCSKQVVDFTEMSDSEIVSYFKHHDNVCGRMHSGQLYRNLLPYTRKQSIFNKVIAAVVLLFQSFTSDSQTQNIKPNAVIEQLPEFKKTVKSDCSKLIPGDSGSFIISITVKDHYSLSPLENVKIFINEDTIECLTMINGCIRIELPIVLKDSSVNLKVIKEGYSTYSHNVILDTLFYKVFMIKKGSEMILGGAFGSRSSSKPDVKKDKTKDLYRKFPGLFRDF